MVFLESSLKIVGLADVGLIRVRFAAEEVDVVHVWLSDVVVSGVPAGEGPRKGGAGRRARGSRKPGRGATLHVASPGAKPRGTTKGRTEVLPFLVLYVASPGGFEPPLLA